MATPFQHVAAELESGLVHDVERLVPGGAAAVFRFGPDHDVITRRAAGPRWRTAEVDAPAWLGIHSHALAQGMRTASPLVGRFMFAGDRPTEARVRELVQLPLVVGGSWWGTLLLLRPTDAARRETDVSVVDARVQRFSADLSQAEGHLAGAVMAPQDRIENADFNGVP